MLNPVARSKSLHLAAKNHRQAEITLARFEDQFPAAQHPTVTQRLQQRELPNVQLRIRDCLRVPAKPLVFVVFAHNGMSSRLITL